MPDSTGNGTDSHANTDTGSDRTAPRSATRRRLLAASGGAAATLLAGCSRYLPGDGGESAVKGANYGDGGANGTDPTGTPTERSSTTASPTPTPETNVTGILLKEAEKGQKFSVTVRPPESSTTDWWQLETLDGERLYRETFPEPRAGAVTTAETLDLDATKLVIRGHDTEYGYGGQVILVDLDGRHFEAVLQGNEPREFSEFSF